VVGVQIDVAATDDRGQVAAGEGVRVFQVGGDVQSGRRSTTRPACSSSIRMPVTIDAHARGPHCRPPGEGRPRPQRWDTGKGTFLNMPPNVTFCDKKVSACDPSVYNHGDPCAAQDSSCYWPAKVSWTDCSAAGNCITDTPASGPNGHHYHDVGNALPRLRVALGPHLRHLPVRTRKWARTSLYALPTRCSSPVSWSRMPPTCRAGESRVVGHRGLGRAGRHGGRHPARRVFLTDSRPGDGPIPRSVTRR
jgi:hypothetical protein